MPQVKFQPTWAQITKPVGYPDAPQSGKLEMIWNTNHSRLYNSVSPAPITSLENVRSVSNVGTGASNAAPIRGLISAITADRATWHLSTSWPATQGGGFSSTFIPARTMYTKTIFKNSTPRMQGGIKYRSDEGTYGLMIAGGSPRFQYNGATIPSLGFGQRWWAGGSIMRKKGEEVTAPYRLFTTYPNQSGNGSVDPKEVSHGLQGNITSIGPVGYLVKPGSKPGQRYGDSVGVSAMESGAEYTNSDIMYQYKYYIEQPFPTKNPDLNKNDVNKINFTLNKTIDELKRASDGLYTVAVTDGPILRNGSGTYDYNRLFNTKNKTDNRTGHNYNLGMLKAYRNTDVTMVDGTVSAYPVDASYKLPTNGTNDSINTLKVLDKDKKIKNPNLKGWTEWKPYEDDLIALYFYDVVNEKYIPFRAAIKGLNEAANASWEEMAFIGRADRVYSYGGFSRTGTVNLKIVISSIAELLPTWQKINYITTAVKPANYTTATYSNITDRFIVPPMFMLTIGDLYKDQPILMQSVTITVPDDASWETMNIDNAYGGDWEYLASMIKAPGVLFGQLPREVDIGFTYLLLEKERAVVGGANFGHAPRKEDWTKWNTDTVPDGKSPNKMHQELVVDIMKVPAGQPSNKGYVIHSKLSSIVPLTGVPF